MARNSRINQLFNEQLKLDEIIKLYIQPIALSLCRFCNRLSLILVFFAYVDVHIHCKYIL